MPTYQFACPNGHEFERFERRISDKSRAKCPTCGRMATRQISGGAGLLFKGSGFYITDYKKSGGPSGDTKASGEGGKSESGKSGDKPSGKKSDKPKSSKGGE